MTSPPSRLDPGGILYYTLQHALQFYTRAYAITLAWVEETISYSLHNTNQTDRRCVLHSFLHLLLASHLEYSSLKKKKQSNLLMVPTIPQSALATRRLQLLPLLLPRPHGSPPLLHCRLLTAWKPFF